MLWVTCWIRAWLAYHCWWRLPVVAGYVGIIAPLEIISISHSCLLPNKRFSRWPLSPERCLCVCPVTLSSVSQCDMGSCYRWLPFNPNMGNPISWLFRINHGENFLFPLWYTSHLIRHFAQFEGFLLGMTFWIKREAPVACSMCACVQMGLWVVSLCVCVSVGVCRHVFVQGGWYVCAPTRLRWNVCAPMQHVCVCT